MKPGAYIRVRQYEDGTVFVVRTNSAGGIAVKYRGYPRPYGYTLYPIYVNKALIEPGIISNKHFVDDRLITFERKGTQRSAPFAIFNRQDILRLALEMDAYYHAHWREFGESEIETIIPEAYGTIETDENGDLCTTKAQRTGCSMCGFGIHLEKRPNRFDRLYLSNKAE